MVGARLYSDLFTDYKRKPRHSGGVSFFAFYTNLISINVPRGTNSSFLFCILICSFAFMFHVERLPAEFNEQNIDVGR